MPNEVHTVSTTLVMFRTDVWQTAETVVGLRPQFQLTPITVRLRTCFAALSKIFGGGQRVAVRIVVS